MTRNDIENDENGTIVSYEETDDERAQRLRDWDAEVSGEVVLTSEQAEALALLQRRRRLRRPRVA